jgi:alpha-beta hydrolase superfamily lysophospholipase
MSDQNPGSTLRDDADLFVDGWSADGPADVTTLPTWFGPLESSLAGWWHLPADKKARAVAVIVAPIGRDHVVTTLTLRILAAQLAQAGIATLRFDLQGTGDSAGSQHDAGIVEGWQHSVGLAIDEARKVAEGLPVVAVGLRMGALLLALAINDQERDVDAVALWDPCVSGKSFLRESKALRRLSLGSLTTREGRVEGMGFELSDTDAGLLSRLTFPNTWTSAARPLVLHRGDEPAPRLTESLGTAADWMPIHHQDALLEPEWIKPRAPISTSGEIAAWFRAALDDHVSTVQPHIRFKTTRLDPLGRAYTETLIPSIAPASGVRLFGVLTEPASASGQTAVFLNSSIETHIGPGRMWTELSRQWVQNGVRSLRLDMSGIGESGVREGQPAHVTYAPDAVRDVVAAVNAVCGDDVSQVTLIGLCSGAYTAVEAGLHLRPAQVATINLPARFVPPELLAGASTADRLGTSLPARPLRALVRLSWIRRLGHLLPTRFFQLLERLGITTSPWAPLRRLTDAGVEVIFVAGEQDAPPFSNGRDREMAGLRERGLKWRELPGLDHATIRKDAQRDVSEVLCSLVPAGLPLPESAGAPTPSVSPVLTSTPIPLSGTANRS